jgi:hypothetical protein
MRHWVAGFLALFIVQPAHGQVFDVPEGFVASDGSAVDGAPDWQPLAVVRPEQGPFSDLSEIVLSRVVGDVADPDKWLDRRLTAEVTAPEDVEELLASPDSPFSDPAFDTLRRALPELFEGLQRMGELPLEFCDPPTTGYNASGEFRERFCTFSIGPLRKYLVLRLQRSDGAWYYTRITTMNERRLRHLVAIANSFGSAT